MSIIIDIMARTRFVDREVRRELRDALQRYFSSRPEVKKAAVAKHLGISRAALYRYLDEDLEKCSTPSPEVLAKLLSLPEIVLTIGGRVIAAGDLRPASQAPKAEPFQYEIPFDVPVFVEEKDRSVTLGIIRKGPNSTTSLEFTVELKLAKKEADRAFAAFPR
jgi:predicted DNA-binding transcriptional regulator AlpA